MPHPVAAWRTEHAYFDALLELLRKELDVFHRGERPNYELMLDAVCYLREFGDEFHHPREDEAFVRLARRRPDMALVLARLAQEHRVIAQAGHRLREQLGAILSGSMVARAEVEAALATYLVYYGSHLAKEEEQVLARAAEALSEEDWTAVQAAAPGADPASGERYRELRRRILLES